MNRFKMRCGSETGQGTAEYILILLITVIIILSLLWQFSTAFRVYAEAFFDGYVACLLETGDLPGNTQCEFRDFNLKDGKKLIAGDKIGGGGGGSGGGSGGNNSSGGSGKDGKAGGAGDSQSGASGSGGSAQGEVVSGNPAGGGAYSTPMGSSGSFGRSRTRSTAVAAASGSRQESVFAGPDALLGPVPVGSASSTYRADRRTSMERGYTYYGAEDEAERAQSRPPVAPVTKKADSSTSLRPKVAQVTLRKPAEAAKMKESAGFSFGGLLKIILIGALILAIGVFFGGQLMQIAKSREK